VLLYFYSLFTNQQPGEMTFEWRNEQVVYTNSM